MKLVCILWLCLLINSSNGGRTGSGEEITVSIIDIKADLSSGSNSKNESEPVSATWADFQTRHIASSDQGSAANWNAFFRRRLPSQYGKKSVNTFIVASAASISTNFPLGVPQYNGGSASNLYWSSTAERIFVLTLSGPPGQPSPNYNVYDCGQKYYVAGLDATRLPVHYQGASTTQGPRIDQLTEGCTKVISKNSFCQLGNTINGEHTECISEVFSGILLGLVIVTILVVAVFFKKCTGRVNNAATNEYSPLRGDDGDQNYGNRYAPGNA